MRAWLLLRWLGVPFDEIIVPPYREDSRSALLRYSLTARVPVLLDGDLTIWDTLAIVEHMADAYPHVWPAGSRTARLRAQHLRGDAFELHDDALHHVVQRAGVTARCPNPKR